MSRAFSVMPDPSSPDERSLPAPYQSPWEALREDIPAAVADLRLRLQELWRRNREGDLSTPGFWPTDLAPLFWPVVLALMLIVVALGVIQLTLVLQGTDDTPAPGIETIRTTPLPEARPLRADPEPALEASNLPGQPLAQELDPPSLRSEKAPAEPESPAEPEPSPSPTLQVDPLLSLLAQADADVSVPEGLLLAARPLPERNAAVLVLDAVLWEGLSAASRRSSAEMWWHMLDDQGYDDITLEDADHRLLARPARVGEGMIMFDPPQL